MHSADCSAPLISLQGRIGWQQLPLLLRGTSPCKKSSPGLFEWEEQAIEGVELFHPTKHGNHCISSLRSVPSWRKKGYVYAQETCNICSWDILQKDWHPSHYVISDRGRNSSLWSVNFMQFFQRTSTGSLKNPFSVFAITSPLPAGCVWWSDQVFFHCLFLKRVCIYCTPS